MILRILISFGGFILSVSLALAASAQVTCDPVWVQHYRFAPRHEYIIHRTCKGLYSGFSIIYSGEWDSARATENITYTYNMFTSTGQLWKTGTGEVRTAADCPRDPWLEAGYCSRFTFEGDGTPSGELKTAIGEMPYPISSRLLSGSQRADLQNSFAQMTNIASQPVEIVAPAPWQVYQIDLPTDAGMTYHVGLTKRVMFIGRVNWPDTVGATQGYGIEFELTGPKRGEIKTFVGQFTPQGYVNTAMNLSPGAYNVRARLTGKHTGGMVAGPWGAWAGFNVVYLYPPANLKARPWGVSICTRRPVRLTWDYLTGGDGIRFTIERALNNGGFQTIDEVDGKARSFVDNSDKPGGIYRYRVKARDNQVQEFSNEASVNFWPVDLPAAPSGLRKAPTQVSGSPSLQWQDNSNNESGFVIERQDPGQGAFKKVGQTEPNRHSFSDIGPKGATGNYAYRVRAIREEGCPSDYSNNLFVRIETGSGSAPGTPSLGGSDDTGNQGTERIRTDLGLTPMENRSAYAVNKPVAFQLDGAAVNNARFEFQHLQGGRWADLKRSPEQHRHRPFRERRSGRRLIPLTFPLSASGGCGPWMTTVPPASGKPSRWPPDWHR